MRSLSSTSEVSWNEAGSRPAVAWEESPPEELLATEEEGVISAASGGCRPAAHAAAAL